MVRQIYITTQKHFIPADRSNNKYTNFICCFDDWTFNFNDLLYWNTEIDLNNKTIVEVLHKLSVAISRLKRENICPKQFTPPGPIFLLPEWWFGRIRKSSNSIQTIDMSDEERKEILLLHLLNKYDILLRIYKKNKKLYCYLV